MNSNDKRPPAPPPLRVAIPDGKGGHTYVEAEVFDLRQPRTPGALPIEVGTRRGIVAAPDQEPLQMHPPGKKAAVARYGHQWT